MGRAASISSEFRNWFFRHFFHLLVIASSAGIWAVPAWVAGVAGGLRIPWWGHLAGVSLVYGFNRFVVAGPRRAPTRWLRRYTAVALGALICGAFLGLSAILFAVLGALIGLVDPTAGSALAVVLGYWGLAGVAAIAATLLFGYTVGQRQLSTNQVAVPLRGWQGRFRIVQLSDIHVGQNLGYAQLEDFVARVNRHRPDLICLTGDIADGPHADIDRFFPLLGRLNARHGVVAILGNHDHYAGADRVAAALEEQGIVVLRDSSWTLELAEQSLHVIGLDDRGIDWARGYRSHQSLTDLLEGAPPGVARVLLVHRPDIFHQAAAAGVELTLSGHTHGGQLGMPWFGGRWRNPAQLMTRFDRGAFRQGDSLLYVNCGLGVTGQRIRLFTPREISVFELGDGRDPVASSAAADEGGVPVVRLRAAAVDGRS